MFSKHVIVTFKRQWLRFLLLGLLLVFSSISFVAMTVSTRSIQEAAEPFFESTNQEDFSAYMNPFLTVDEQSSLDECSTIINPLIQDVYTRYPDCYEAVLNSRLAQLESLFEGVDYEYRYYKDVRYLFNDHSHRVRFLKDAQTINLSYLEEGQKPTELHHIAINKNYAINNNLSIGDTLTIDSNAFEIVGFVLFPDYNLPVFDHIYLFDTIYQTLGLLTDQAFDDLSLQQEVYVSGSYQVKPDTLEEDIASLTFITHVILTENNVRSGAIYTEIEAGQGTGLALSVIIAFIGIMIVIVMVNKSLEQSRGSIGIFKALGGKVSEMMVPYLIAIAVFALIFLTLGIYIGYRLSPLLSDLYLMFYLLPSEPEVITFIDVLIAIFAPFITVMTLSYFQLKKMMYQDAIVLMRPKVTEVKGNKFKTFKNIFQKFHITTRIQIAFLFRQFGKVIIYSVGVISAVFLMFLSMGMVNLFEDTIIDYYASSNIQSVVYCYQFDCDAKSYDRVLEMPVIIESYDVNIVGIDKNNTTRNLLNRRGESLNEHLDSGIIISQSFADISRISVGDTVSLEIANEVLEIEVLGIAALYPGNTVYYQRELLSLVLFNDDSFFNVLYSDTRIGSNEYDNVVYVDEIVEQVRQLNEFVQTMMYFIMVSAGIMALIIIYLLTVLVVEEQTYEISLFKVIGYNNKEISRMVLGGYRKLNILLFGVTIPLTIFSYYLLRFFMMEYYRFYMPLKIAFWHIIITAITFIIVYAVASLRAKHNVARRSLQEALKITQV